MVLTPAVVKGLEYQSVCVLEPGPTLQRLGAGVDLHSNAPELEAHSRRTAIDRLRVAISRTTENLAFIEIAPDDATQMSSRRLLGDATTYSPDDLVEYLTNPDTLPESMVPELINRVGELIDTAPGRAWQLAGQAVHLLGLHRTRRERWPTPPLVGRPTPPCSPRRPGCSWTGCLPGWPEARWPLSL